MRGGVNPCKASPGGSWLGEAETDEGRYRLPRGMARLPIAQKLLVSID
mgnify:FL=1